MSTWPYPRGPVLYNVSHIPTGESGRVATHITLLVRPPVRPVIGYRPCLLLLPPPVAVRVRATRYETIL